jgi:hypothetical protein
MKLVKHIVKKDSARNVIKQKFPLADCAVAKDAKGKLYRVTIPGDKQALSEARSPFSAWSKALGELRKQGRI